MAMNVAIFRHSNCDGAGSLGATLRKAGEDFTYVDTYLDDISSFDALAPDLLIVLGGAPGVYQAAHYPFITREVEILEKRLAADLPTLGICLGAQMMAKALGANVYKGPQGPEKGWYTLKVNEAGMKTPVRHFDAAHTSMLQWHGDTFDMPEGAVLLASSDKYPNQIFSWGRNTLALQCHAEASPSILRSWLVNAADEVAQGTLDLEAMRRDNERHNETLMRQSEKFLLEWLAQIRREKAVA